MRALPVVARIFLLTTYVFGGAALVWLLVGDPVSPITATDIGLTVGLTLLAAATQVFGIYSPRTNKSDQLTPAPFFAALLLLPQPALGLLTVLAFLPEWYVYRRQWFIALFNIASYAIAAALSRWLILTLTGEFHFAAGDEVQPLAVLGIAPVFWIAQTVLLALVLKLARNHSIRESGLFAPNKILFELALACMGIGVSTAWLLDPLLGIAAVIPLAYIFQALHVPNLLEEAQTDPKTGLANMRRFNDVIARDFERAERAGQRLSILMCDLDFLRNINNTYGHQAGDVVLIGIAQVIQQQIRGVDVAARFGGEEFVVLLPDSGLEAAARVAERIRSGIEHERFTVNTSVAPIGATVSIGVASYPDHGVSSTEIMHEADLAVYQAKREGRNRVCIAGRQSRELAGEWAREHLVAAPSLPASQGVGAPKWKFVSRVTRNTASSATPLDAGRNVAKSATQAAAPRRVQSTRPRRVDEPPVAVLLVIGLIFTLGIAAMLAGQPWTVSAQWWALGLFAALTLGTERASVELYAPGNKISVAVVIVLAAAFLFGTQGIIATVTPLVLATVVRAHSPIHRAAFNLGAVSLTATAALVVFRVSSRNAVLGESFLPLLVPAVLAGLVFYVGNHGLICFIRSLTERRSALAIWKEDYQWLWPHYMVFGALALVVAMGFDAFGWSGLIALMAPVAMMHLVIKQYMDRTSVHVQELRRLTSRLTDSYEATLQALTRALDTRDEETEEHSQRVMRYTEVIAKRMKLSDAEIAEITRGALLHDIGKIGVPDAILLKRGSLDAEERLKMQQHPEIGFRMIAHIPFLAEAARVVLHHHEAYDGGGYPSQLAADAIPLGARIFAVADTFDAITSDRPYRSAQSPEAAIAEIKRCRGTQFDPRVVDTFLTIPLADLRRIRSDVGVLPIDASIIARPEVLAGELVEQ